MLTGLMCESRDFQIASNGLEHFQNMYFNHFDGVMSQNFVSQAEMLVRLLQSRQPSKRKNLPAV